jgi:N-acetylglucosaminyldiphosphoundecaprenol N-acetyl-beta-D-mannosaminyltransferase
MLIHLDKQIFITGKFDHVINFLFDNFKKPAPSKIILPCSLNDLALQKYKQNSVFYKNVDYCTSDSMFITRFLHYKYKTQIDRVYGPDLMQAILEKSQNNSTKFKHYFLAPNKTTMEALAILFEKKYKKIDYKLAFLPNNITKNKEIDYLKKILISKADVIWIGIGSPKQIKLASWLKHNSQGINILCVGAAFDFLSGRKKQAPLWIRKSGLEWLFRLINEPKRLWRRYLIIIPRYLISFLFKESNSGEKI